MTLSYAAIDGFKTRPAEGAHLRGWAWPKEGSLCCALNVYAGGSLVLVERADRYEVEPAEAGIRDGWCAFDLHILDEHLVLAESLDVRCAASGRQVLTIRRGDVVLDAPGPREGASVKDILTMEFEPRYQTLDPLIPIMERIARKTTTRQALDTWRRLIDGVPLDAAAWDEEFGALAARMSVTEVAREMFEKKPKNWRGFPSPFSDAFPAQPLFAPTSRR